MSEQPYAWYVGIDWASESHQVCVLDAAGARVGERSFEHTGPGLAALADWLLERPGAMAAHIAVAIEVPRGAVVETLVERGFAVFALNPKQLDRFRDRHTVAGAKDDRRDARVLADSLRTDQPAFRPVRPEAPPIVELRELSRLADELQQETRRLANRLRDQLLHVSAGSARRRTNPGSGPCSAKRRPPSRGSACRPGRSSACSGPIGSVG